MEDDLLEQQVGSSEDVAPDAGKGSERLSVKDVVDGVQGAFSPVFNQIGEALGQLANMVQERPAPGGNGEDDDPNEELQNFLRDPDARMDARIAESMKKQGPLWDVVITEQQGRHMQEQERIADERFGKGAWKEHLEGPVRDIIKKYPMQYQMSRAGVASAVAQILGQKYDTFKELEREQEKVVSMEERRARGRGDYQRVGPGRSAPARQVLSEDEARLVSSMAAAGIEDMTEENYKKWKNEPSNYADWKKTREGKGNGR